MAIALLAVGDKDTAAIYDQIINAVNIDYEVIPIASTTSILTTATALGNVSFASVPYQTIVRLEFNLALVNTVASARSVTFTWAATNGVTVVQDTPYSNTLPAATGNYNTYLLAYVTIPASTSTVISLSATASTTGANVPVGQWRATRTANY